MRFFPILVVLLLVLIAVLRVALRGRQHGVGSKRQRSIAQPTVPCAACGVHVPAFEAIRQSGNNYCSRAHADKGAVPQHEHASHG